MSDSGSDNMDIRQRTAKKRKTTGRISEVMKRMREQSHEIGEDCRCKRLKCFSVVDEENRLNIIRHFNTLVYNEQNNYLAGLISLMPVKRRRATNEATAKLHDASYSFRVRTVSENGTTDTPICFKAFLSFHGIGRKRLENIQKSLKASGSAPTDKRGKNKKKHALSQERLNEVLEHIRSFKGRESHYSKKKQRKYTFLKS